MSLTLQIYYTGFNGSARKFAEEMISSGLVEAIRNEEGNIRYDYFLPMEDPETVLLIDCWRDQEALDFHHKSEMMKKIIELRKKYHIHMQAERFLPEKEDQPLSERTANETTV